MKTQEWKMQDGRKVALENAVLEKEELEIARMSTMPI